MKLASNAGSMTWHNAWCTTRSRNGAALTPALAAAPQHRCKCQASLRLVNDEAGIRAGPIGLGGELVLQPDQVIFQPILEGGRGRPRLPLAASR